MKDFIYKIMIEPTNNIILQMFRYCFVGGVAFVADNGSYYLLNSAGCHYMISAVVGFMVGLVINYLLSKLIVFKKEHAKTGAVSEFVIYGVIGAAGLGITEALLWVFVEKMGIGSMAAKLIASVVTLIWNFAARKIILYKEK